MTPVMGKLPTLTLVRDSLPPWSGWEKRGNAVSDNSFLERVASVAKGFILTLDLGVCLRADCTRNECQRPLLCHKRSDNSGSGMISENHRITCSAVKNFFLPTPTPKMHLCLGMECAR
jgi:hypothetical protein